MKEIEFCSLFLTDFKSFRGKHHLVLDRATGVWFVGGRNRTNKRMGANGVGKSTIWDALLWCLYGTTVAGLHNPDITPWKLKGAKTRVTLIANITTDGKAERCVIARTAFPNSLKLNHQDVGQETITDTIGMDYDLITNTIILGQGRDLFFDLTAGKKLELLSTTMQLDRWDERSKDAKYQEQQYTERSTKQAGQLVGLQHGLEELKKTVDQLTRTHSEWEAERKRNTGGTKSYVKLRKRLDELNNRASALDAKHDSGMTEVKACERQVQKYTREVEKCKSDIVRRVHQRYDLIQDIQKKRELLEKLKTAEDCPMCGQPVDPTHLKKERVQTRKWIKDAKALLKLVKTKQLKEQLTIAEQRLKHEQSYLSSFHAKSEGALSDLKNVQVLQADVTLAMRTAEELTDRRNPHSRPLREAKQQLRDLRDASEEFARKLRITEKRQARAKFWVKGFKEIKLHVLEEVLQELELVTNGMLEEVGLTDWSIKYQIARETKKGTVQRGMTILVRSPESDGMVRWESWSGGEGQRLRLVGALALSLVLLSHAGVSPSMEALDEPTQHLSDEGIVDLSEFLALRAIELDRRIFYSDHRVVDSMRFTGRITIRRDNKGSEIIK